MMERTKILISAFLAIAAPIYAANSWTFNIPSTTGTFTAAESVNSVSISGDATRLSNGFIQMTVNSSSGTNKPEIGEVRYGLEIPGFAFFSWPFLTNEKKLISTASAGVCPTSSWTGIMVFYLWTGTAGVSTDVNSASVPAFGVFTWDPALNQATVSDLRNLTSYATLGGFSSFVLGGSCSNGVITFSGAGDRGGTLYVSSSRGGVYMTNTSRAIFIIPQVAISSASRLDGTYAGINIDESAHTNIWASRITIASGTSGSGDERSDIAADTANTAKSWSFTNITIDTPVTGTFTADVSLEGSATRKCVCATYFSTKTALFCALQNPADASRPMNFILAGDSHPFGSGALDTYSFGGGTGRVANSVGAADGGISGLIQSNGRIVVGGYTAQTFSMSRFMDDGTLDSTFGTAGEIQTDMAVGANDRGQGMSLSSSGKIAIVGYAVPAASGEEIAVAQYTSNGILDTTFNTTGKVFTTIHATNDERAMSAQYDSNDKLVVGGWIANSNDDGVVLRYTTDGALDTAFGTSGIMQVNINGGGNDRFNSVVVDSNGRPTAFGYDGNNFAVVRFTTAGILDSTFGTGGVVTTNSTTGTDRAQSGVVHSNGTVLAAGYGSDGVSDLFVVNRYTSAGILDTTFGTSGTATVNPTANQDRVNSIAIQLDGKIVVAGAANNGANDDMCMARFTTNGVLDTTFGTSGLLITSYSTGTDIFHKVVVQSDGKLVGIGHATNGGNTDHAVFRIWP